MFMAYFEVFRKAAPNFLFEKAEIHHGFLLENSPSSMEDSDTISPTVSLLSPLNRPKSQFNELGNMKKVMTVRGNFGIMYRVGVCLFAKMRKAGETQQ